MHGFSNLDDFVDIMEYDIISLSETWLTTKPSRLPFWMDEYNLIWTDAVREASTGRASGGLTVLIRKNFEYKCLSIKNHWIITKITTVQRKILLVSVYFKPVDLDMHAIFKDLQLILDEQDFMDEIITIYIGGDFNAKMGKSVLNYLPKEVFFYTNIESKCILNHGGANERGECLTEFMMKNSCALLNGRTISDRPGKITFVNYNGESIVDHVWARASGLIHIEDLEVKHAASASDHFPLALNLWGNQITRKKGRDEIRVKSKL